MMRPALVRRRAVWLPTLWGWLVLLVVGTAAVLLVARNLYEFLALNDPVGARILVVEGWMDPEGLDQAVAAFRARGYERVLTSGGPIEHWAKPRPEATYAEIAAGYLKLHGLGDAQVTAVPAPISATERTYMSAAAVRDWVRRSGLAVDAIDVYSWGPHARRSRMLYRLAFGPEVKVGVFSARSSDYDPGTWWRTSIGAKEVLEQAGGLLWQKCFFWPASGPQEAR
jgi:hypothetical protein